MLTGHGFPSNDYNFCDLLGCGIFLRLPIFAAAMRDTEVRICSEVRQPDIPVPINRTAELLDHSARRIRTSDRIAVETMRHAAMPRRLHRN
jgi:hypothetical protein